MSNKINSILEDLNNGTFDANRKNVAMSADKKTVAIGEPSVKDWRGIVYIYNYKEEGWSQLAILAAEDGATNDAFGYSVSLSADGSTALVGAYNKSSSTGAAYIFTRSGSTWTQQQKITASDAATSDAFGISVSLSADGSTALVGAYYNDPSGVTNAGASYFYG